MSAVVSRVLSASRLVLTAAGLLSLVGLLAWLTMPRQEDPSMERRFGMIMVAFPGAEAEAVERLVTDRLEERLASVDQIKRLQSRSRAGFAVLDLEFRDDTSDFAEAWDEVDKAVKDAQPELPAGVGEPVIDRDTNDQDAIVVAITGSTDPLVLADAARLAKRRLLSLSDVSGVEIVADPGEQITVEYDESTAQRLGIDARTLAGALQARNVTPAGGAVRIGSKTASLRPASEFRSIEEIDSTPILLRGGSTLPLGEIAKVRRGPAEPATERMRHDGRMAVGLGVVAREGIDLVAFGRAVRTELDQIERDLSPLRLEEVAFQPEHVEARITDLGRSLLLGIAIVAVILFVAMGARLGLVVAGIVPLVALSSLALYATGGGLLHQISIAALVIALGMLVDNAIVVAENIQRRIDAGEERRVAAMNAVRELMVPLGTATGTTLAAFIPMFLAEGGTADFTRAIPIVIMLTLTMSYAYALLVTPTLSALLLRRSTSAAGPSLFDRVAAWLGRVAVARYQLVLVVAAITVAASIGSIPLVEQRFFPSSDRSTVMVDLALPEGSHIDEIDRVSRKLETVLMGRADVTGVDAFIGRSAPHFYYNLMRKPNSPHLAQLVVHTRASEDKDVLIGAIREMARTDLAGVEVVARGLEQGPPLAAPVEVRLLGDDLDALRRGADRVIAELKAIEGAADVRHDLSLGAPTVVFEIDDAAAARRGLSRADVARALLGRTRGLEVGQYRAGDDPVPILVRGPAGEDTDLDALATTAVATTDGGGTTPMSALAQPRVEWRPAVIAHRNRKRTVSVLSELRPGVIASEVLRKLRHTLGPDALPDGVKLEYGGEAEGSSEANAAMLRTLPLGVLVLLVFLMAEFNSFRRVGIIMATVPLALTGVIPGLLLGDQPFGFMSLLGVIALVGVVVNNAIVLLDVVERRRQQGSEVHAALAEAVRTRTRPILLTTATTVAGLLPLALSKAALWPPLAWAMITGLLASTALTLLVVPALYRLLFPSRARAAAFDRT